MDQTLLGIGTRLQHTVHGPGVIVGTRYATYLISFIHKGIIEVDKTDTKLDDIQPENVSEEIETNSQLEKSLLKILRLWGDVSEVVKLGEKWVGGSILLQPKEQTLKPKEINIDVFFHKIVMARDRLRVLEQSINSHKKLTNEEKINFQQYITRVYGSFTTFNVLFKNKEHWFEGDKTA